VSDATTRARQRRCNRCRQPIESSATGRRRRFCSPACRQSAYRKRAKRSVHFSSATPEWATPHDLFAELDREFSFTLDVAATQENAKCERFFTRKENGLAQQWTGHAFCNPPYGREIGGWIAKAWESAESGACDVVVCLVPARVDTAWWHDYCARGEVRFLRGRVRFGGAESGAPFPSAVVVFRNAFFRYETGTKEAS
jgi:phage N-6-adenine-methyltransferase